VVASIKFMHKLAEHSLQITIRNVFDEEYSVIRDYPLPGRHLKISIITNF
jgi:outer membrane cobalamin receptor